MKSFYAGQEIADKALTVGGSIMVLVHDFYSLCRSITGPGLRATLRGSVT